MIIFLRKIVERIVHFLFRVKVHGKENFPYNEGALIVANHQSLLDPVFILSVYAKKNIYFLAKKEASTGAMKIMQRAGAIPIDRENPSLESLMRCIKTLKSGNKLVVFPEGTRNRTGTTEIQELKDGAEIFAVKAKAKIVPIIIGRKAKLFCRTHVVIGEPFELSDFYGVKINDEVTSQMNNAIKNHMIETQKLLVNYDKKLIKKQCK